MNIQPISVSTSIKNYSRRNNPSQTIGDTTKETGNLSFGLSNYNILFQGKVPLQLENPSSKTIIEKLARYSKCISSIKEPVVMSKPALIKDGEKTYSMLVNRFPNSANMQATIKMFNSGNEKEISSLCMSLGPRGRVIEAGFKDSSGAYKYSESKCGLEQYIDCLTTGGHKQRYSYRNGGWKCTRQDDGYCNRYIVLDFKDNPLAEIFTNAAKKGVSVF